MRRRLTSMLCGAALVCGLALVPFHTISTGLQARALTRSEADRAYDELDGGAGPLVEGSRRLAQIAQLTTPSVVHIQSERNGVGHSRIEETGSGVLMTSDRAPGMYAVTNRHVVSTAELEDITVHVSDGRVLRPVRVWSDAETDVAVLKLDASDLQPARWGDSDRLDIGSMVLAMGSPFGLSRSVTFGIISAKGRRSLELGPTRTVINQDFLQTDAAINPGNSGGPLFDMHGRVVAINTAIASSSGGNSGIGFSIPSNLVRNVVDQLLTNGKVQRSYLGVKLDAGFDLQDARRLRMDRLRGALVDTVYPETPAARAGLEAGDVILRFRGTDVFDHDHLIHLVSLTPVGTRANLEILRDGRSLTVVAVVDDRADLQRRSASPPRPATPYPAYHTLPMGLRVETVTPNLAVQAGYDAAIRGLLVLAVRNDHPLSATAAPSVSASASAPAVEDVLQLYDVIEEAGRRPVRSAADLRAILGEASSGEPLLLKVRRHTTEGYQSRLILWHAEPAEHIQGEWPLLDPRA
jgi:serine protease Do